MAKVELDGVYRVVAKGRAYYYAWKGRGAPRLHAEPGSAAFIAELAAAHAARKVGPPGKLKAVVADYRASPSWTNLSDKTRASWRTWLDRIQEEFGGFTTALFDKPTIRIDIRKWRDRYAATPRAADMGLQVFSHLMAYAVEEGTLTINPVAGIKHLYRNDRSSIIWLPEDFDALRKVASPELLRAAELAALTGLRQGDLLRLSWSHIGELAIEIRTGKSGERKTTLIPLYDDLRAYLAAIPKTSPVVLVSSRGTPWKTGFGSSWQDAVKAAGIDKHFHDLRGTFATVAYKAGFSIREIAELMTWSEEQVESLINRYVKRDELLRDRIRRMDEARTPAGKTLEKPT